MYLFFVCARVHMFVFAYLSVSICISVHDRKCFKISNNLQKTDDIREVQDLASLSRFCVEGKGGKNPYLKCLWKWGKCSPEVDEGIEIAPA